MESFHRSFCAFWYTLNNVHHFPRRDVLKYERRNKITVVFFECISHGSVIRQLFGAYGFVRTGFGFSVGVKNVNVEDRFSVRCDHRQIEKSRLHFVCIRAAGTHGRFHVEFHLICIGDAALVVVIAECNDKRNIIFFQRCEQSLKDFPYFLFGFAFE